MVSIPSFDTAGNLPEGRHPASVDEVRKVLVDGFPSSRTRSAIFEYWAHHREALLELVEVHRQWLAGSFTSDKPTRPTSMSSRCSTDRPSTNSPATASYSYAC
ncbi:hypothetical protein BH24ACT14_BH24ACT14_13230 [soil metagenome]